MQAGLADDKQATEHLANERTFLAWIRTSIAVMGLRFIVSKFGFWLRELAIGLSKMAAPRGSGLFEPAGMAMIGFGGLVAVLAVWRFHYVNRQITLGMLTVDRGLVVLITAVVGLLAICLMVYSGLASFSGSMSSS